MLVAWTTVADRAEAETLAALVIERGLAACVQIDGPITSIYRWEGKIESTAEFRLLLKFVPEQLPALRDWILRNHPYDTPEWIVLRAEEVGEKYLKWAQANSSNLPL